MKYILLTLISFLSFCGDPNSGISSNPNFVKGKVIDDKSQSGVSAQIIHYSITNLDVEIIDTIYSNENGDFDITLRKNDYIQISSDSSLGFYSISDSNDNYFTISEPCSYTSNYIDFENKIDSTKNYVVVARNTPYSTELKSDLSYSFTHIPQGTFTTAIIEITEDGFGAIIDTSTFVVNSGDEVKNISKLDSVVYIADSSNLIIKNLSYTKSGIIIDNPTTDFIFPVGITNDSIINSTLIKPIFADSITECNILQVEISLSIYYTNNFEKSTDTISFYQFIMLQQWNREVTAAMNGLDYSWNKIGVSKDDMECSSTYHKFIIVEDQLKLVIQKDDSICSFNGILLEPSTFTTNQNTYFFNISSTSSNNPIVKIYFTK